MLPQRVVGYKALKLVKFSSLIHVIVIQKLDEFQGTENLKWVTHICIYVLLEIRMIGL